MKETTISRCEREFVNNSIIENIVSIFKYLPAFNKNFIKLFT